MLVSAVMDGLLPVGGPRRGGRCGASGASPGPDRSLRRVAQFETDRQQPVAQAIGQGQLAPFAQAGADLDQKLQQRSELVVGGLAVLRGCGGLEQHRRHLRWSPFGGKAQTAGKIAGSDAGNGAADGIRRFRRTGGGSPLLGSPFGCLARTQRVEREAAAGFEATGLGATQNGNAALSPNRPDAGRQVERDGRVFIDPQDDRLRRQERVEAGETVHPHEAGPRVMRGALGVVPGGHDGQFPPLAAKEGETFGPGEGPADLVDLVDRKRVPAEGDRRHAGEDQLSPFLPALDHRRQDGGIAQLIDGIGRAARAGDDVVGFGQGRQGRRLLSRGILSAEVARQAQIEAEAVAEILLEAAGDRLYSQLESGRGLEKNRTRRRSAELLQQLPVDLDHAGRDFAGADQRDEAGGAHRSAEYSRLQFTSNLSLTFFYRAEARMEPYSLERRRGGAMSKIVGIDLG